ncbi:MAG: hypothetical protein WKF58_09215 [Ilumatobacteraceae bacterium]
MDRCGSRAVADRRHRAATARPTMPATPHRGDAAWRWHDAGHHHRWHGHAEGTTPGTEASDDGDARDLIIARDMDLTTLDPQRVYCDTCQIYMTAIYETLIGVDPADITKLVPAAGRDVRGQRRQHRVHVHAQARRHVRRRITGHVRRRQVLVGAPGRPRGLGLVPDGRVQRHRDARRARPSRSRSMRRTRRS